MNKVEILTPLQDITLTKLHAGDQVYITGVLFTARDAAHRRFMEALAAGQKLPFELHGQVIYYTGPTPARPGRVIGSAGPTTSGRMDIYTPALLAAGLKGMIGKGRRSGEVKEAMLQHGAVYFAATGGAAALIARSIRKAEVIAYPELGAEAVYRLEVEKFPAIVVNDIHGGDLYEMGKARYAL
jgi:fumarate hydratase subunit beta